MLATIYLPDTTNKVAVKDIPALIANVLHPIIPENTERQITRLMKMATTAEKAANWCGDPVSPFPVSLTDDDLAGLASSVWAELPPLKLPISESAWQPYFEAHQTNLPADWKLEPRSHDPSITAFVFRHSAVKEWEDAVRKAAMQGQLTPRHPTTFLPQPQASGEWLLDCFVTVADLTQFLTGLNIGVASMPVFTIPAQLREIPEALIALDSSSEVEYVESHAGYSGKGRTKAADLIALMRETIDRQSKGFYTLQEAAQAIADANQGVDSNALLKKLKEEFHAGRLTVRAISTQAPHVAGATLRDFLDWVTPQDIDVVLSQLGVTYRFPNVGNGGTSGPVSRQLFQEQEILRVVGELGYKADALPKQNKGKAGVKSKVRAQLNFSAGVFDKAWERLRTQGDIKDAH